MNTLQALLSFALAVGLLTITPGLDTALILRTATVKGSRPALWVGLGIALGCLIWCILAAVGLGAVLATSRQLYDTLRLGGACYLFYLGIQLWRKSRQIDNVHLDLTSETVQSATTKYSIHHWFRQGLLTNLLNPKVGVFYVTFMPQFLPANANVPVLGTGMGLIHASEGLLWCVLLILATRPLSRWLRSPQVTQTLDRLTGSLLIGFGAKLALEPKH